jgi:hypothetical protein
MKNFILQAKAMLFIACFSVLATSVSAQTPLFQVLTLKTTVADYAKWRTLYDGDLTARKDAGLTQAELMRTVENPNTVMLAFQMADLQKAKDFIADPRLKEKMQKGGVIAPPEIAYHNVIRADNSPIDVKDRLLIMHHVKDFDGWMKVFDAEGKAARATNGFVDRVVTRDMDDPNMVTIVFAVTDWTKAKAALASETLKTKMMNAGVDSAPIFLFCTSVE